MDNLYIDTFCIIRKNRVVINNKPIFESEQTALNSFLKEAYKSLNLNYPKFFKMDSMSKLGFICAEFLLSHTPHFTNEIASKTGLILSNAASSLDTDLKYFDTIKDSNNYFPSPSLFVYTLPNLTAGEICIRHQLSGENCFFIMPQFDPIFLYNYVSGLFENKLIESALTGWVELINGNYEAVLFYIYPKEHAEVNIENIIFDSSNLLKIYTQ